MKIIRRGSVFVVDFRDPRGRRMRISTGVRIPVTPDGRIDPTVYPAREAEAYAEGARIVQRALLAESVPALEGQPRNMSVDVNNYRLDITLGEALERQYREHWSRMAYGTTMRHVVRLLVREMGHLPLSSVTYEELRRRADAWLRGGAANGTVNRRLSAIGCTLREAHRRKELSEVPTIPHYTENPYVKERYLEVDEEARLLEWFRKMEQDDAAERRPEWAYMRHLVVFLLDTGFRFSEAFKFRLVGRAAYLPHGCTKNTLGRSVPLTARALEAARFLLNSPLHRELSRRATPGRPKAAWDWCSHRWDRATRETAINPPGTPRNRRLTLHSLRHTCASRLVQRGVDLYVVSKWLGHSGVKVTQRYAHLAPETFEVALAALQSVPPTEPVHDIVRSHPTSNYP